MRTTVIPAQVTTVEDTIAGNLTFTQIMLLVSSLFGNTFVYAVIPEKMMVSLPKIILMISVFAVCIGLSLRIKGRLVVSWLNILATYSLRPHLYLYTKNTVFARDISLPNIAPKKVTTPKYKGVIETKSHILPNLDYASIVRTTDVNVRFKRRGILIVKNYDSYA